MKSGSDIFCKEAIETMKWLGITDEKVHLIDLVLLIEIMRTGGQTQKSEIDLLENYLFLCQACLCRPVAVEFSTIINRNRKL